MPPPSTSIMISTVGVGLRKDSNSAPHFQQNFFNFTPIEIPAHLYFQSDCSHSHSDVTFQMKSRIAIWQRNWILPYQIQLQNAPYFSFFLRQSRWDSLFIFLAILEIDIISRTDFLDMGRLFIYCPCKIGYSGRGGEDDRCTDYNSRQSRV